MKLTFVTIFCALHALSGVAPFTLECDFGTDSWTHIGDVYLCKAINIPDSSDDNTITAVTGTHLAGRNNDDVTALYIYGRNRVSFFPRESSQFFPNLRVVYLRYMTFEELHGDELSEFPELESFAIHNSKLVSVSSKLFERTKKITVAFFGYNQIQRVGHDLFTPFNVSQLSWVDFIGNNCINRYVIDGNTTAIKTLIDDIRVSCPFDDEVPRTTTTTTTKTTSAPPKCYDGLIDDFICAMDEKFERKLGTTREQLEQSLVKIKDQEQKFERELGNTKEHLQQTRTDLDFNREQLEQTRTELGITQENLQEKSNKIGEIESEMRNQEQKFTKELALMREQLKETMESLRALKEVLT